MSGGFGFDDFCHRVEDDRGGVLGERGQATLDDLLCCTDDIICSCDVEEPTCTTVEEVRTASMRAV